MIGVFQKYVDLYKLWFENFTTVSHIITLWVRNFCDILNPMFVSLLEYQPDSPI